MWIGGSLIKSGGCSVLRCPMGGFSPSLRFGLDEFWLILKAWIEPIFALDLLTP